MLDRTTPSSGLGQLGVGGLLYDALTGRVGGVDQVVPVGHHVVILNRMPITSRGRLIGSVTTLRDRTELVSLQRELDVTRHTTESGTSSTTPSTRCGTQHSWVEVTVNQTPDDVTVVVRDSGPGVPADLEGRICFSTKSSTVGGRGSGLALIQHI